jgi:8-oxo-dGTP pyrophosphatase MutT (NUDIX family)
MVHAFQRPTRHFTGGGFTAPYPRRRSKEVSALHDLNNRQGAGVLLICTKTRRMLLAKRGLAGAFPSTWAPFGGMVEPGEATIVGALREVQEEAGIGIGINDDGLIRDPIYVDKQGSFAFFTFAYLCDFEPQVELNDESAGYGWFTLDEAKTLPLHPGMTRLLESPAGQLLLNYF